MGELLTIKEIGIGMALGPEVSAVAGPPSGGGWAAILDLP
jgi:hypothetical protein